MTIETPPRPPRSTEPSRTTVEPGLVSPEPEALIEEARARARRRRRKIAAALALLVISAVGVMSVLTRAEAGGSSLTDSSPVVAGATAGPRGTIAITGLVGAQGRVFLWTPAGVLDTRVRGRAFGWSPDGSRLLVQRGSALYAVRLDTGREVLLTSHGDGFNAVWSPDGSRVAFEGGGIPGHYAWHRILVVGANGRGARVLPGWAIGGGFFTGNLTWTPKGDAIVFSGRTASNPRPGLYRVSVDGNTPPTPLPIAEVKSPSQPTFSPDGTRLAFTDSGSGSIGDLIVVEIDGSHEWRLEGGTGPVWSPDSKMLAIRTHGGDGAGTWTVRADGTHKTHLPQASWAGLSWSPDSHYLAYAGGEGHLSNGDIFAIHPDGTNRVRLVHRQGPYGLPLWKHGTATTEAG